MIYRDSKGRFCKAPSIKGYKGFKPGLICLRKQYKVGEVFTEPEAIPCMSGIHFCKNPLAVLKFYPPVSSTGIPNEYAEVEALEEPVTDDNIKFCTTKLKIVRKLSLDELIQAGINYALQHKQSIKESTDDYSAVTNTGNRSAASNTGNYSIVANTGDRSTATSTGDCSTASNTGYCSAATNIGYCSAASVSGKHSVAVNTGCNGKVKGALSCWIACAEWKCNAIVDMQMRYVDGKKIKADTWYMLENGEFVEVN